MVHETSIKKIQGFFFVPSYSLSKLVSQWEGKYFLSTHYKPDNELVFPKAF